MRKFIAIALVFTMALGLTACAGGGSEIHRLNMATGGDAGTYYAFGGVIASVLTSKIDNVEVTAQTSGGSIDNARKLKNKEAEIAFMQNDVLQYAVTGTESMKDDGAMENLCAIASLYPEAVQLVATKSSGIKTIADLKGKKVCVGDQGSGSEVNASQIIAAAGMSYSDFDVQYLSFSEASTAMQNGTVDAAFATSALPNSAITELANYTDIVVVPIDGDIADNLIAQYPFYAKTTIGTDVYGVEAAETVAMMAVLTTTTDSGRGGSLQHYQDHLREPDRPHRRQRPRKRSYPGHRTSGRYRGLPSRSCQVLQGKGHHVTLHNVSLIRIRRAKALLI